MNRASRFQQILRLFSSLRLTIFLLLALALGSLIGTLLPQGLTLHAMKARYGPITFLLISWLHLQDLYHSPWFQALIALLAVNIIVCSLERFPKTVKFLGHREAFLDPAKLRKFHLHWETTTPKSLDQVKPILEKTIEPSSARLVPLHSPERTFAARSEKGRWTRYTVYLLHASVLVILFGALIGSLWGFRGFMDIAEGQSSRRVQLYDQQKMVVLPFDVRCDAFHVAFYPDGTPKDYRSDLTIVQNGREVLKRSIRVNSPMTYGGITFYQASYGSFVRRIRLRLSQEPDQDPIDLTLRYRRPSPVPGTDKQAEIMDFQEDFHGFGPAVALVMWKKDEAPRGSWILVDHPTFHGNRIGAYRVRVLEMQKSYYTGLQVKRDPGVVIVITGFVLLLLGIFTTFYTSHKKILVWAHTQGSTTSIVMAARSSKKSLAFEREFQHLCDRVEESLK